METINTINKFDILMMCFTSVDGSGSNLLFVGNLKKVVDEAFKEDIMDDLYFVDGIVSRKKQIIPTLSKLLKEGWNVKNMLILEILFTEGQRFGIIWTNKGVVSTMCGSGQQTRMKILVRTWNDETYRKLFYSLVFILENW